MPSPFLVAFSPPLSLHLCTIFKFRTIVFLAQPISSDAMKRIDILRSFVGLR